MPSTYEPALVAAESGRKSRLAEAAGAEHLGATLYELAPGNGMHFHYHLGREELLIVLTGRLSLRTGDGWTELPEGEVVAFPRGERGARLREPDRLACACDRRERAERAERH